MMIEFGISVKSPRDLSPVLPFRYLKLTITNARTSINEPTAINAIEASPMLLSGTVLTFAFDDIPDEGASDAEGAVVGGDAYGSET
mmetsp:Transcript_8635/g.15837  ORF Transcript_8635/g.15837 Transcript_8635/m.15837 type:complete len:86 (+) Transcript_8635:469-726(+)